MLLATSTTVKMLAKIKMLFRNGNTKIRLSFGTILIARIKEKAVLFIVTMYIVRSLLFTKSCLLVL